MPVQVWDAREHIQNLVARPDIRARFNRIQRGAVPQYHSHDLGGEIFLVLDGEVTFDVEGEVVTCGPGQAIYVPPHVKHRVYTTGDRPATYYLSVTPHVEPTHTTYDAELRRQPPRYGTWRGAGDPNPPSAQTTADLADEMAREAEALAKLAQDMAAAIRRQAATLGEQAPPADGVATKQAIDAIWEAAYPALRQVRTVERIWNELALRAAPNPSTGG